MPTDLTPDVLADLEAIRRLTCDYGFYWDTRDLDGYVGCFLPDGAIDSRPSDPNIPIAVGHDAIRALAGSIIGQQIGQDGGGVAVHAQDTIIEDDRGVMVLTIAGTDMGGFMGLPPTGKAFRMTAVMIFTVINGQVLRYRSVYDFTGLLAQVGNLRVKPA